MYGVYRFLCEDRYCGIELWIIDGGLISIVFIDLCILFLSKGFIELSDMIGIEFFDFKIDKFIILVKSC